VEPVTRAAKPDGDVAGDRAALPARLDPVAVLARLGVTLRLRREPLHLPGKRVLGSWDPLLRRIELFGCDEARSDAELVRTLGHEIGHWLHHDRFGYGLESEIAAERFTEWWVDRLGPASVRRWAAALRGQTDAGPGLPEAGGEVAWPA
jgi:hypothetical protein